MIGIDATVTGVADVKRAYRAGRTAFLRRSRSVLRREMIRGNRTITTRYRSRSAPGPGGTAVKSGRYRASYTQRLKLQRGRRSNTLVGEMGLLGLGGLLPIYFLRWEGDLSTDPGRPSGGALKKVERSVVRRSFDQVERIAAEVL